MQHEKNMKTIKFYKTNQFGNLREFIHPDSQNEAGIIAKLTGQKTINVAIRELLRDLTTDAQGNRGIEFQQVIAPE